MPDAASELSIDWLTSGISKDHQSGALKSTLASSRYRVLTPSQSLTSQGYQVRVLEGIGWKFDPSKRSNVIIVGKILPAGSTTQSFQHQSKALIDELVSARIAGASVIADFNDDHFDHPLLGDFYRKLSATASLVTVGSEVMGLRLAQFTDVPIHVIGDPLLAPKGVVKHPVSPTGWVLWAGRFLGGSKVSSRTKFVWYGSPSNWSPLKIWAKELLRLGKGHPFCIWVVTSSRPEIHDFIADFNQTNAPLAFMDFVEWSEEAQWETVRDADFVLIPADSSDQRKLVKTANRLTDALYAGRPVIASPVPSYTPYAPYVWLGDDPVEAVLQAVKDPLSTKEKATKGLAAVEQTLSSEAIGRLWSRSIETALLNRPAVIQNAFAPAPAPVAAPSIPVKLNLGCGDKILPGYVNVDVVESRAGKKPDVLSDLHDLSVFSDGYADEILSVHVVEHFWRWEIRAVLSEWIRVLKPGGAIIIECPNLLSACQEFIQNPVLRSGEGKDGQRTMWVFYGDPAWKDPYMIHRWGYTPDSLASLLVSCGLINVRQEAAQFKLREPRDMRVVAIKPNGWQSPVPQIPLASRGGADASPEKVPPPLVGSGRPTFGELFYAHKGNKTSKWAHYLEIYQRYFAPFRDKPCRILEIGVQNGGSLSLYQKYFSKVVQIVGVDIDPRCSGLAGGNIAIEIGSQADAAFLESICDRYGPFDIVIDDASHIFSHQRVCFETVFPRMCEEGVYIVEDVHSSYAPSFGGGLNVGDSFISYCKAITDQVNAAFFPASTDRLAWLANYLLGVSYYDSMVVMERRPKQSPYFVTLGETGHVKTSARQDIDSFRSKHYSSLLSK